MREELLHKEKDEQDNKKKVCQFYIVLGHYDQTFQNNDENRYFIVSGNEDIHLIQYALSEEWKKKKKENIGVASEIIFLIPDLSYEDMAKDLMDKLNCRGKFQVVKPIVKEEIDVKKEKNMLEDSKEESNVQNLSREEFRRRLEQEEEEESISEVKEEKIVNEEIDKDDVEDVKKKDDHVFYGDFPKKKVDLKDSSSSVADYMWGEEKSKNLMLNKKRKLDLPVIIFIISLVVLIVAGILLFVLK